MAYTQHDLLCKQINQYLDIVNKNNNLIHFHVPNEGKGNVQHRVKQKVLGVKAGVPDFCVVKDALWLEVKTGTGRLSTNQKEFFLNAYEKGHKHCYTVRSFDEFLEFYKSYTIGGNSYE